MTDNKDLPAFPHLVYNSTTGKPDGFREGLTKREYTAIMIAQGLCANSVPGQHHRPENLIRETIEMTDALLNALNY